MIYSEACSCGAKFHIEENSDRVERIDQMIGDWRRLHGTRCASYPWVPAATPTREQYEKITAGRTVRVWEKPATAYEVVNGWPEVTGRAE